MDTVIVKTLRRLGLGSLTGTALYLLVAVSASAAFISYTSLFTIGSSNLAWFTLGNDQAWFIFNNPDTIAPTYSVARIILPICIGLIVVIWEAIYIFGSEEVDWVIAITVAIVGVLVIIISQVIWSVL